MAEERDKAKRQKELFLKYLEKTPVIVAVCQKTKVAKSNVYRWMQEDFEFKQKVEQIREEIIDGTLEMANFQLMKKVQEGYFPAVKYALDRNKKSAYKQEYMIIGRNNFYNPKAFENIKFNITTHKPREEDEDKEESKPKKLKQSNMKEITDD
jgi:anti-sigma28 factor (negative regulator of flagellin synthesis)